MPTKTANLCRDPVERVRGIEPPYSAWEADVLPMNYTRGGRIVTILLVDLEANRDSGPRLSGESDRVQFPLKVY